MWTRTPIFQGGTEQQQLKMIGQLCGSLNAEVWPAITKYELFSKMELPKKYVRQIEERFRKTIRNQEALDVIDKLLVLDPEKRISANDVLDHDFFFSIPKPAVDMSAIVSKLTQSNFELFTPSRNSSNKIVHRNSDTTYQDRIY